MRYTAADFEKARFAENELLGLAVRLSTDPEYTWTSHDGGCYTDQDMAEMGWVPVFEAAQSQRAAQTLGRVIDDQCRDVLDATQMHDQVDADGDGDWQVIWERMADLCEKGRKWEALLDGEAVERVADILEALDGDDYLTVARAALAAATGEDEEDE